MKITEKELKRLIAAGSLETQDSVDDVLYELGRQVQVNLADGNTMVLPNIGVLIPVIRPACQRRNPRTGVVVNVPAKLTVKFRASKNLKDALK